MQDRVATVEELQSGPMLDLLARIARQVLSTNMRVEGLMMYAGVVRWNVILVILCWFALHAASY